MSVKLIQADCKVIDVGQRWLRHMGCCNVHTDARFSYTSCTTHDVLTIDYLKPLKKPRSSTLFAAVLVSANTLSNVVRNVCRAAGFAGYFTNHSSRTTAATRLFEANIDEQLIKLKTGHNSDSLRSYKRVNERQLSELSDVIACRQAKRD